MVQACLIFNPVARGGKARHLRENLDKFAHECELQPTTGPNEARRLAAQAIHRGFRTIIAAGGDGTVNEVLNGIGDVPEAFSRVRLGVIPLGTVNVFARELGIPLKVRPAWDVIRCGQDTLIDLPVAEFLGNGRTERRYFAQLGGAGLDSRAVELVSWRLKTKIGPLAYVVAGLQALLEPHPVIEAKADSASSGELVLFGNGRYYGGTFPIFPKASLSDGLLDVCVFQKVSWFRLLRVGLGMLTGQPDRFCRAIHFQTSNVTLSSERRVLLELDGENTTELPVRISLIPNGLRVIVPQARS